VTRPGGVPLAERLFVESGGFPALLGSRCTSCQTLTFPVAPGCPRCGAEELADEELPRTGTLWTWTSQGFLPKHPYSGPETDADFVPWFVGSVELGGELRVEGRLVGCTQEDLQIGMALSLVLIPFGHDAEGHERLTFAFEPSSGADRA
jgi:uncharacterized OB-fold protein